MPALPEIVLAEGEHDRGVKSIGSRNGLEVRLIHGRGKGVQRAVIQALLVSHPLVSRFFDAPPERGGWGATVVVLLPR